MLTFFFLLQVGASITVASAGAHDKEPRTTVNFFKEPQGDQQYDVAIRERKLSEMTFSRVIDNHAAWTDSDCENLVKIHKPDFMLIWKALSPRLKMWDAIRPLILKVYGGIYIDADVSCHRPFTSILTQDTKVLLRANWHKTLGYITKFESTDSIASGNHIMGSVPQHPIWDIYLRKIVEVQREDPTRTVTKHTGNSQLENSVIDYLHAYPEEGESFKLMDLSEFENIGECERMDKLKYSAFQRNVLGKNSCTNMICTHMHALVCTVHVCAVCTMCSVCSVYSAHSVNNVYNL